MVETENNQVNDMQNVQLKSNEKDPGSVASSYTDEMFCDSVPTTSTDSSATSNGPALKDPDQLKRENKDIEEEDDPVVHEIPVFLAQSLAKQLFLYQV